MTRGQSLLAICHSKTSLCRVISSLFWVQMVACLVQLMNRSQRTILPSFRLARTLSLSPLLTHTVLLWVRNMRSLLSKKRQSRLSNSCLINLNPWMRKRPNWLCTKRLMERNWLRWISKANFSAFWLMTLESFPTKRDWRGQTTTKSDSYSISDSSLDPMARKDLSSSKYMLGEATTLDSWRCRLVLEAKYVIEKSHGSNALLFHRVLLFAIDRCWLRHARLRQTI